MSQPEPDQRTTRRRRGAPRGLLLESGRELFSRQGYAATSTREIAEQADVSETLLFRYFESKSGLFREAVVVPFIEVVETFNEKWQSGFSADSQDEQIALEFIGELYDLFRKNRALVAMLWTTAAPADDPAMSGIVDEINQVLQVLVRISSAEAARRGDAPIRRQDLATRTTIAMIAGMAMFGSPFYGSRRPARTTVVAELTRATLHGHLHRRS